MLPRQRLLLGEGIPPSHVVLQDQLAVRSVQWVLEPTPRLTLLALE